MLRGYSRWMKACHKSPAAGPDTNPQAVWERNLDYTASFCICCWLSWSILFLWEGIIFQLEFGFGNPSMGHMLKASCASGGAGGS